MGASAQPGHHFLDEALHVTCRGIIHKADHEVVSPGVPELLELASDFVGIARHDVKVVPADSFGGVFFDADPGDLAVSYGGWVALNILAVLGEHAQLVPE